MNFESSNLDDLLQNDLHSEMNEILLNSGNKSPSEDFLFEGDKKSSN